MKNKLLYQRYLYFRIYICIALLPFAVIITRVTAQAPKKPNIILILADDIGYKALTCNGGNLYATPNIDTLAKKGMRFTQCHAAPTCSPSRFLLLTGKYNFRNYTQWGIMDRDQKTLGNMFKDAGYKTACFGKWQLEGGDLSIKTFGFDKYLVHDALDINQMGRRYKNPNLYTNGAFLPAEAVKDKYGPDIIRDSLFSFIDNNKNNPFFIYYPMLLCHAPFQPTPDDSDFFKKHEQNDTSYFPSMMKYMDGELGKLITKLKNTGIDSNTLIIYVGDNGTSTEVYDHDEIKGGKGSTKEIGTHVPLIAYWPGRIEENSLNKDLIDFTDFLPTLAGIIDIPVPTNYGILDGVSFFPALMNQPGTPRDWIFYHYDPNREESSLIRWAQTKAYKLYDTSAKNNTLLFYDIINDPKENNPIPDGLLTPEQIIIKQQLLEVINSYVSQGVRILNTPKLASATDTSAKVANSIIMDGASTITASGVVWGTEHNPVLTDSNHTSENVSQGSFYSLITGLKPATTYFLRTYATNVADTAYSEEISFTTKAAAPPALPATQITNTSFTANWGAINGTAGYRVDVSTSKTFSSSQSNIATEEFNKNKTPDGWFINNYFKPDTINYGKSSPSLKISIKEQHSIITPEYEGNATRLSFWLKGASNDAGTLLVQGFDGLVWLNLDLISYIPRNPVIKVYDAAFFSSFATNFKKFKFVFNKTNAHISFDDVEVKYSKTTPSFVTGYQDTSVASNSLAITKLKKNTAYYYRARTKDGDIISENSNTVPVKTNNIQLDTPVCTNATGVFTNSFVAHWDMLENADLYKIDVSTSPTFSTSKPVSVMEAFNKGLTPPDGWKFGGNLKLDTINFGKAAPSIRFFKSNQSITTAIYPAPAGRLSFFIQRFQMEPGSLLVEGFDGKVWKTIENITTFPKTRETKIYDASSVPVLGKKFIQFRFTFTKVEGQVDLDDIKVNYTLVVPSFLPGYHDSTVYDGTLRITELENNTQYYYRVRAISTALDDTSANSNVIDVITCPQPVIPAIKVTNPDYANNTAGSIDLNVQGDFLNYSWTGPDGFTSSSQNINNRSAGKYHVVISSGTSCSTEATATISESVYEDKHLIANVYPNPSATEFTLIIHSGSKEQIAVTVNDMRGRTIYQSYKIRSSKYVFGESLAPGIYFVHIIQGNTKKTIKIIKAK